MTQQLIKFVAAGSTAALLLATAAPAFAGDQGMSKDEKNAAITINHKGNAVINRAKVESVGISSFTINIWGLVWTVNVTDKTKIVRRFHGSSGLAEMTKGDVVYVHGNVVPAQLAVHATLIRDDSTRAAEPNGKISGIAVPDMFTVTGSGGKTWSVKVAPDAEIKIGGQMKTFADLAVGMRVQVKGYVNLLSSLVTAYRVSVK